MILKQKFIAFIVFLSLVFSPGLALAEDVPTPPSPPPAPSSAPAQPTPPSAPQPSARNNTTSSSTTSNNSPDTNNTSSSSGPSTTSSPQPSPTPSSSPNGSGGVTNSGNNADTAISTGTVTNSTTSTSVANSNVSSGGSGGSGAVNVDNSGNGVASNNNAQVSSSSSATTNQSNTASLTNSATQTADTGSNNASKNVGSSTISTGDANTSASSVAALNTNVSGVSVYEFNVADDKNGDLVLNFNPSSCVIGCGSGNELVTNSSNGVGSANNASVSTASDSSTFQSNDSTVGNTMTLASNSGNNIASKNTAGDTTVKTGDANVQASALTFANNNLAGKVVYAVVNVFGNLVGDIILPQSSIDSSGCISCSQTNVLASNGNNGTGSSNNTSVGQSSLNNTLQSNSADIVNNLNLSASTGANDTDKNTGGNSTIETGTTHTQAQVLNVANTNLSGGNIWLVLVNQAGKWVGEILGAPEGSTYAGSGELAFNVGSNGEITATNEGNGQSSSNATSITNSSVSSLSQNNNAAIVNNLNLSAHTGGNNASENTGGDTMIETGNATVIANIINFVNNNISGNSKLFVTVVNVFGSWFGDFVSPGQTKRTSDQPSNNSTNVSGLTSQSDNPTPNAAGQSILAEVVSEPSSPQGSAADVQTATQVTEPFSTPDLTTSNTTTQGPTIVASFKSDLPSKLSYSFAYKSKDMNAGNVIRLNLAWLLLGLPIGGGFWVANRRRLSR